MKVNRKKSEDVPAGTPRLKPKGAAENRRWNFTPAHWARLLEEHNAGLDERGRFRAEAIAEFRSLLANK